MGFLDSLPYLVANANNGLNGLFTGPRITIDPTPLGEGYRSLTAARRAFRPFIIGLIPPDIEINFKPIDKMNQRAAVPAGSTVAGQSASAGVNITPKGVKKTLVAGEELKPERTKFTCKELGDSICNSLRERGYDEGTVNRLAPLMVGNICAETALKGKTFTCNNYNIGNVHAGSAGEYNTPGDPSSGIKEGSLKPPKYGKYVLGYDTVGSTEKGKVPGQKYPVYFQASSSLDESTGRWIDTTTRGWPGILNAQNPTEYVAAIRPDLHGGPKKPYFTSGEDHYVRMVNAGSGKYGTVQTSTAPTLTGINGAESTTLSYQGIDAGTGNAVAQTQAKAKPNVDIITTGNITAPESDDPLRNNGRNIRVTEDKERFGIVEKQVDQINNQIRAAKRVPPLGMLINPSDFSRSYEHSIDAPKVRRGHIIHLWLEKPLSISCKGVTAAQYILNSVGDGGLTNRFRAQSLSHLNLMSLVRIYKNNGYIFSGDAFGELNSNMPLIAMSVYIYYDGHIYLGSFDDFSVMDSADKPYNMDYSFRFTARYDIDVTSITDNQIAGLE